MPCDSSHMKQLCLHSGAFEPNGPIPRLYTEDGRNVSPPLFWSESPMQTQSFALLVEDPDAPTAEPWIHWLIWNIPPKVTRLDAGIPPSLHVSEPGRALQGRNSWGRIGYGGPAPPAGQGPHRYHFTLYALDSILSLSAGAPASELRLAMDDHVIGKGLLLGVYERS